MVIQFNIGYVIHITLSVFFSAEAPSYISGFPRSQGIRRLTIDNTRAANMSCPMSPTDATATTRTWLRNGQPVSICHNIEVNH